MHIQLNVLSSSAVVIIAEKINLQRNPNTEGYLSTNKSVTRNFPEWQIKEQRKILWANAF